VSVSGRARRLIRGAADPGYGFPDDPRAGGSVEAMPAWSSRVS